MFGFKSATHLFSGLSAEQSKLIEESLRLSYSADIYPLLGRCYFDKEQKKHRIVLDRSLANHPLARMVFAHEFIHLIDFLLGPSVVQRKTEENAFEGEYTLLKHIFESVDIKNLKLSLPYSRKLDEFFEVETQMVKSQSDFHEIHSIMKVMSELHPERSLFELLNALFILSIKRAVAWDKHEYVAYHLTIPGYSGITNA